MFEKLIYFFQVSGWTLKVGDRYANFSPTPPVRAHSRGMNPTLVRGIFQPLVKMDVYV